MKTRSAIRPASAPALRLSDVSRTLQTTLVPSVGPTPRPSSACSGRSAVMLPSQGALNDAARVKNGGKALWVGPWTPGSIKHSRTQRKVFDPSNKALALTRSSSAPMQPSQSVEPVTPRRSRGMVRKASKVTIDYPQDSVPTRAIARQLKQLSRRHSAPSQLSTSRSHASDTDEMKARASPSAKRVSFEDQKKFSLADQKLKVQRDESGNEISLARQITRRLQGSLFDLRRVSVLSAGGTKTSDIQGVEDSEVATAQNNLAKANNPDSDDSMLHKVLSSVTDTEVELKELQQHLEHGTTEAAQFGGSRHPTSVMSNRLVAVLQRRAILLREVEAEIDSFERAHARREEILADFLKQPETYMMPPELSDLRKFVAKHTHAPGNPADANKSDFESFVAHMKLPSKHRGLDVLRDLKKTAGEWWADSCMVQASNGAGHAVLKTLFDLAVHIGVDSDHPKLVRAMAMLMDRLAARVLEEAEKLAEIDAADDQPGKVPLVGMASRKADMIEANIAQAVKDGVAKSNAQLQKATEVVKTLRERDGLRKRMAGRMKRLEGKAR